MLEPPRLSADYQDLPRELAGLLWMDSGCAAVSKVRRA